ncbi:uncharacterized protein B0P05DRAFT_585468 [Gilbertella persicaria]|uniref:uncharacterized protein n=1 Tax=Gilbertella persicaria TaxID=101096 RepID=UPI00221F32AC|nr:uncharacterized protein B0P05DRAFT_585468 [Gilbertella persicaria]KAI8085964.1 hypothetical protein B0P05DRAFT_585468 [Gilbertella persicaria]
MQMLDLEYFNNSTPRFWDFLSYKEHVIAGAVRPPRNKKIRAKYVTAIKDIGKLSCVNSETKDYLESLIKPEEPESDKKETQVINQYINYGSVGKQGSSQSDKISINIDSKNKKRKHVDDANLSEKTATSIGTQSSFTTDETTSYKPSESSINYGEALKTSKYTLTLNELGMA